jgi:hypothetical protein
MAVVEQLREGRSTDSVHPTTVECEWSRVDAPGAMLLQLTTFGSSTRQLTGKASQTIQIDRKMAEELVRIIRQVFPGL